MRGGLGSPRAALEALSPEADTPASYHVGLEAAPIAIVADRLAQESSRPWT